MNNPKFNLHSRTNNVVPMKLQFFADPPEGQQNQQQAQQQGDGDGQSNQNNPTQGQQTTPAGQQNQLQQNNPEPAQVSLSQEALNGMMAREKGEGRRNILRQLGLTDSPEDLKKFEQMAQILNPQQQTAVQDTMQLEQTKELLKAQLKAEAFVEGAKPEFIDDLVTLGMATVNMQSYTPQDLKTAVNNLKLRHTTYFNAPGATGAQGAAGGQQQQGQPAGGTGQAPGGGQGTAAQSTGTGATGYDPVARAKVAGKMRAERNKKQSSYFK